MGYSRGGLSTKVHIVTDSHGLPLRLSLTGGQAHDITQAPSLLKDLKSDFVLADRAYDKKALVDQIHCQGSEVVIPCKVNRKIQRDYDKNIYKMRNLIERTICKLKNFRRIATRYEKRARNFLAMIMLASSMLWLN